VVDVLFAMFCGNVGIMALYAVPCHLRGQVRCVSVPMTVVSKRVQQYASVVCRRRVGVIAVRPEDVVTAEGLYWVHWSKDMNLNGCARPTFDEAHAAFVNVVDVGIFL
jgi:hypothetical protein